MGKVIEMPEQQPPQLTIEDFQKQIGAMSVQMMMMSKTIEQLNARIKELESTES